MENINDNRMLCIGMTFDFNNDEYKIIEVHINGRIARLSYNDSIEFSNLEFILNTCKER